jgi:hypothetical protein
LQAVATGILDLQAFVAPSSYDYDLTVKLDGDRKVADQHGKFPPACPLGWEAEGGPDDTPLPFDLPPVANSHSDLGRRRPAPRHEPGRSLPRTFARIVPAAMNGLLFTVVDAITGPTRR